MTENQSDSVGNDKEEDLNEKQSQSEASEEGNDPFEGQSDSVENNEEDIDDDDGKDQEISDQMGHEVTHEGHSKNERACDITTYQGNDGNTSKTIITPLKCTYHRGKRDVFAASKRQRAISPPAIKPKEKGKERLDKGE